MLTEKKINDTWTRGTWFFSETDQCDWQQSPSSCFYSFHPYSAWVTNACISINVPACNLRIKNANISNCIFAWEMYPLLLGSEVGDLSYSSTLSCNYLRCPSDILYSCLFVSLIKAFWFLIDFFGFYSKFQLDIHQAEKISFALFQTWFERKCILVWNGLHEITPWPPFLTVDLTICLPCSYVAKDRFNNVTPDLQTTITELEHRRIPLFNFWISFVARKRFPERSKWKIIHFKRKKMRLEVIQFAEEVAWHYN